MKTRTHTTDKHKHTVYLNKCSLQPERERKKTVMGDLSVEQRKKEITKKRREKIHKPEKRRVIKIITVTL